MGGGHHHEPFQIPNHTIYNNYRDFPELAAHERRLQKIGLKDPWIRNYTYLYDKQYPHVRGQWAHFKQIILRGWKPGVGLAAALIAVEEVQPLTGLVSLSLSAVDESDDLWNEVIGQMTSPQSIFIHAALPIEGLSLPNEGRLLHQMLQLFTPAEEAKDNSMIPPYGINAKRQLSKDILKNQRTIRNDAQVAMSPWAQIAEEVMDIFETKPSTATVPSSSIQTPFLSKHQVAQMLGGYGMLPPMVQGSTINEFANSITSSVHTEPSKAASYIDTGGPNFDRFVIHENQDRDNFLGLGSLMGQWNERGLQWSDGKLRLVNMNGKNVLGSQVAVHDKSVDIPVQQWLNMASNLFDTYRGP